MKYHSPPSRTNRVVYRYTHTYNTVQRTEATTKAFIISGPRSMMATSEESAARLPTLPVDAQPSILAFLSLGDLAHFSVVSRGWHGVGPWTAVDTSDAGAALRRCPSSAALFGDEPRNFVPCARHISLLCLYEGLASGRAGGRNDPLPGSTLLRLLRLWVALLRGLPLPVPILSAVMR
jgi:hypothetical protein